MAVNARILATPTLRGWSRYAANLIRELSHFDIKIHLLSDRKIVEEHLEGCNWERVEIVTCPAKPYILWEQFRLPKECERLGVDLLHCPHHFGLPIRGSFKKVLTLHDTIGDSFYNSKKRLGDKFNIAYLQSSLLNKVSRDVADHILTVSEFSRREIIQHYKIAPEKITVTYNAAAPSFSEKDIRPPSYLSEKYGVRSPYFFYVGGWEERKNLSFLVRSFKKLSANRDVQLVLAGGNSKILEDLANSGSGGSKNEKILFLPPISEEDLVSFYAHARCFVYPSLYEGFGLQVVESMQMGTPVIASRYSSLPEIVDNQEALFDPTNEEELVDLLSRVLTDTDFYNQLCQKASKRASQFSWRTTAEKTYKIYQDLLKVR